MDVSDNKEFVYEDLGASLAYKFDVSGSSIEIYYYDKDNLFEGADKVIEENDFNLESYCYSQFRKEPTSVKSGIGKRHNLDWIDELEGKTKKTS